MGSTETSSRNAEGIEETSSEPGFDNDIESNPSLASGEDTCPTCLSSFRSHDTIILLQCGHIFCKGCLTHWSSCKRKRADSCPLCRKSYLASDEESAAEPAAEMQVTPDEESAAVPAAEVSPAAEMQVTPVAVMQ